jgi:hypothetical protein
MPQWLDNFIENLFRDKSVTTRSVSLGSSRLVYAK